MVSAIGFLKWIGIALVSILLLADLVLLGVAIPGQNLLSNPEPWKKIASQADLYSLLEPAFEQNLFPTDSSLNGTGFGNQLQPLIKKSFSREWFQGQTDSLIDSYFNYANSKTQKLELAISLQEPKASFLREIRQLPEIQGLDSSEKQELESQLSQSFPGQIDLASKLNSGAANGQNPFTFHKQIVSILQQSVWVLAGLAALFAVLLIALLRKPKVLIVFGTVLLLAGLALLAIGVLATPIANQAIASMHADASFQPLLQNFSQAVLTEFSGQTTPFAFGYLVAGIAAIAGFGAFTIARRKPKKQKN